MKWIWYMAPSSRRLVRLLGTPTWPQEMLRSDGIRGAFSTPYAHNFGVPSLSKNTKDPITISWPPELFISSLSAMFHLSEHILQFLFPRQQNPNEALWSTLSVHLWRAIFSNLSEITLLLWPNSATRPFRLVRFIRPISLTPRIPRWLKTQFLETILRLLPLRSQLLGSVRTLWHLSMT